MPGANGRRAGMGNHEPCPINCQLLDAPGSKPCDEGEEIGVRMRIVLAEARKAKTRTFAGDATHAVPEPG
jgi:hypothetical protein